MSRGDRRATDKVASTVDAEQLRLDLVVQEYISLRNESLAAKQNQQSILQWSLATVGIGIAAVFTTTAVLFDPKTTSRLWMLLADAVILGVAVPLLVGFAFGIWLGEVDRMERAGNYLRDREQSMRDHHQMNPSSGSRFLPHWEMSLKHPNSKNRLGSAASCLLFSTLFCGSLISALFLYCASGTLRTSFGTCGIVVAFAVEGAFLVLYAVVFGPRLWRYAKRSPALAVSA